MIDKKLSTNHASVFRNDYLEDFFQNMRSDVRRAELELENAKLKVVVVDLIQSGANVLHSMFEAGGEPKWRVPEEREYLLELSDKIHSAFNAISGGEK